MSDQKTIDKQLEQGIAVFSEIITNGMELVNVELSGERKQLHLSQEQLNVLHLIMQFGPLSSMAIARKQGVHKSAVSNRLKKMMEQGFVRWQADPEVKDNRIKLVELTAKGREVLQMTDEKVHQLFEDLLDELDEEKLAQSLEVLSVINARIKTKISSLPEG